MVEQKTICSRKHEISLNKNIGSYLLTCGFVSFLHDIFNQLGMRKIFNDQKYAIKTLRPISQYMSLNDGHCLFLSISVCQSLSKRPYSSLFIGL